MTKDMIGVVNQVVVPTPSKEVQCYIAATGECLEAKNVENEALRVAHQDTITMLHGAYEIE